ncbi:hypothetical protein G6F57_022781 [Rhizopus arrhizus]|nr:hypothetical protein G6F57_022781 [Rhizopus arrhizus]
MAGHSPRRWGRTAWYALPSTRTPKAGPMISATPITSPFQECDPRQRLPPPSAFRVDLRSSSQHPASSSRRHGTSKD